MLEEDTGWTIHDRNAGQILSYSNPSHPILAVSKSDSCIYFREFCGMKFNFKNLQHQLY